MLDSGAAVHCLSERQILDYDKRKVPLGQPQKLLTANGPITVDHYVTSWCPALKTYVDVLVLENSPELLSLGKLCRDKGFNFHWDGYKRKPRMWDGQGREIRVSVRNNVPYILN